ncbi:MAG: GNAT family N-acetyltransferase [Nanoarchaeota archaeon]
MKTSFVPSDFQVPKTLDTKRFKLRMLTVSDVVKDYDAVMTSIDHLKGVFGPHSSWPSKGLTLEQDLIDLGWHQKEFQKKSSFAYTMMSPDETKCLGCVYFYPSDKTSFDAMALLWVRTSEVETGLDQELFEAVKKWLQERWPFKKVAFPGRDISWEEWNAL